MGLWPKPGPGSDSPDDKEFGRQGEAAAVRYLSGLGYRILERNYRTPAGELDIVAMDGPTLVFVEVKSRRGTRFGSPADAVDSRKRRRMEKAALSYMTRKKAGGTGCRFDVVGVTPGAGAGHRVEHVKDAFEIAG